MDYQERNQERLLCVVRCEYVWFEAGRVGLAVRADVKDSGGQKVLERFGSVVKLGYWQGIDCQVCFYGTQ